MIFNMKKIILSLVLSLFFVSSVLADVYVNPYNRSDGTSVKGHWRSSPDSSTSNNWSTKGNTNPYTGKRGSNSRQDSIYGNSLGNSLGIGGNSLGRSLGIK